ncbi:MAG: prpE [Rhodospirillaceae bacterium]|nr:MAG: prpE [Rhodospirillaceae bacterium]
MNPYELAYRRSLSDPQGFWGEVAENIHWDKKWEKVLDDSRPPFYRWFRGGVMNTCYNAVDRHVAAGRGGQNAILWDSPVTGNQRTITYAQLQDLTARLAGALAAEGVTKGDRVVIYMPMIPEALIAMLACARIGAVHSVVFGGFAPNELATRINDARPKVIVSASCGVESARVIPYKPLLDQAIALSTHKPERTIIVRRPEAEAILLPGRDRDYEAVMAAAKPADCVPVAATDPLYILYTSGTTGDPKGIVRDNGGHAVALAWTMTAIYDVRPGAVFWAASDVGWVVGHSYIVYAPLLQGCTTVVYEGKPVGTPDAGAFWRMITEHRIGTLFTAPTAFRAIKREDPNADFLKKYDLAGAGFRALFLAGERSDPDTLRWAEQHLNAPVIDHWWQTETGWAIAATCLGLHPSPIRYGSAGRPAPGWDVCAVDEAGDPAPAGHHGPLVCRLPLPPGSLATLWQREDRYRQSYLDPYPGFYQSGDAGYIDDDGHVYVMARTDDIINVAGHRLSTGAMEEVLAAHPDVAECAVMGVADALKGQIPLGLVCLKAGVVRPEAHIIAELVVMVREQIGAVAAFKTAAVVKRLPKTRSGKILRGTVRKIADNEPCKVPATIDDPAILQEIKETLTLLGYAQAR